MPQEDNEFDFAAALKAIQAGKPLLGQEGILTPLIKNPPEAALEAEMPPSSRNEREKPNPSNPSIFQEDPFPLYACTRVLKERDRYPLKY